MTTLKEFLTTVSADNATALTEARAHTETRGRMITSDVMTMLLVGKGLYAQFSDIAADAASPARGIVMAFMDRVRTNSTFNFQSDHPKGQANLAMVDALVQMLPGLSVELGELKAAVLAEASETVTPFANVTLTDIEFNRPEEVPLVVSAKTQHVIEFGIAETLPEMVSVIAMHRYGPANDLTPWHPCGSTRVQYKQSGYKIMVPGVDAEVREMKLTCDHSAGIIL